MAAELFNLRPALAGGVKTDSGENSDFELRPSPSQPTTFWELLIKGSWVEAATVLLKTGSSGVVTLRVDQTDKVKVEVIENGVQVYPPV